MFKGREEEKKKKNGREEKFPNSLLGTWREMGKEALRLFPVWYEHKPLSTVSSASAVETHITLQLFWISHLPLCDWHSMLKLASRLPGFVQGIPNPHWERPPTKPRHWMRVTVSPHPSLLPRTRSFTTCGFSRQVWSFSSHFPHLFTTLFCSSSHQAGLAWHWAFTDRKWERRHWDLAASTHCHGTLCLPCEQAQFSLNAYPFHQTQIWWLSFQNQRGSVTCPKAHSKF